jgi:hypothetical protein
VYLILNSNCISHRWKISKKCYCSKWYIKTAHALRHWTLKKNLQETYVEFWKHFYQKQTYVTIHVNWIESLTLFVLHRLYMFVRLICGVHFCCFLLSHNINQVPEKIISWSVTLYNKNVSCQCNLIIKNKLMLPYMSIE